MSNVIQYDLETGEEKVFRYLNSYERYLVHTTIADDESLVGITTYSANVGDQRWLTICLEENVPTEATDETNEEVGEEVVGETSEEVVEETSEEIQDKETQEEVQTEVVGEE